MAEAVYLTLWSVGGLTFATLVLWWLERRPQEVEIGTIEDIDFFLVPDIEPSFDVHVTEAMEVGNEHQ